VLKWQELFALLISQKCPPNWISCVKLDVHRWNFHETSTEGQRVDDKYDHCRKGCVVVGPHLWVCHHPNFCDCEWEFHSNIVELVILSFPFT
jgi:hypothetical protein